MGSAVDVSALDKLASDLGDEFVADIIGTFLTDLDAQMATIRKGGDGAAVKRAAHTLKSTSRMLGAESLATIFQAIEGSPSGGGEDGLVAKAEAESLRVKSELNTAKAKFA